MRLLHIGLICIGNVSITATGNGVVCQNTQVIYLYQHESSKIQMQFRKY